MRESRNLEFKETISNTFLKTVSAYANYGDGVILFGVEDNGTIKGIDEPVSAALSIENTINDAIQPRPNFIIDIDDKTNVIKLTVLEGQDKPYLYKSKAYRRHDSSSVEVDKTSLLRLILEGSNITFDALPAVDQNLYFSILETYCKQEMGIEKLSEDNLITLELYNKKNGFNIGAELLADINRFEGIDIARFGADIDTILYREIIEKQSILKQYERAMQLYRQYYQYEQIKGMYREKTEKIPEEAFREAVANSLVHRSWDSHSHIRIFMFDDHIRIVSPGGLLDELSESDYIEGEVSKLRNPIIGNIFFRLHLIERFGTGIQRILKAYKESKVKPIFKVNQNSISITLPLVEVEFRGLTSDDIMVYNMIHQGITKASDLVKITGFGRTKVQSHLHNLIRKDYVEKRGNGRSTEYISRIK